MQCRCAHNKAATAVTRQAQPSARRLLFLLTCCVELTTLPSSAPTGGVSTYQKPSILQNHKRRGRLHEDRAPCWLQDPADFQQ